MADFEYPRPHLKTISKASAFGQVLLSIVIVLVVLAVVFPVFAQHGGSKKSLCLSHIKQMSVGLLIYSGDNDDRLPQASRWMEAINASNPIGTPKDREKIFREPEMPGFQGYGYAFRKKASTMKTDTVEKPTEYILVFDSILNQRNAASELDSMPQPGCHNGGDNVGYVDGHAKWIHVSAGD